MPDEVDVGRCLLILIFIDTYSLFVSLSHPLNCLKHLVVQNRWFEEGRRCFLSIFSEIKWLFGGLFFVLLFPDMHTYEPGVFSVLS